MCMINLAIFHEKFRLENFNLIEISFLNMFAKTFFVEVADQYLDKFSLI